MERTNAQTEGSDDMSLEMLHKIKRLTLRVEQLEQSKTSAEDISAYNERIKKLEGEIKAMKARMGKNAKAE